MKTRKSCIFEIDFEVYNVYRGISTLHLVYSSSMVSSSISLYSSSMEYQWFWMISSSITSTEDETNASIESSDPAKISGIRIVIPKSLIAGSFAYNIFVFCWHYIDLSKSKLIKTIIILHHFLFTSMVAAFFCVLSHHSLKLNLVTVSSILINVSVYEFHQIYKLGFSFDGCEKVVPCDWYIRVGTDFNDTVADDVVGTNSNDTVPVDVVYEGWVLLLLLKFNSIIEIMMSSSLDPYRMSLFCGVENPIGFFLLLSLYSFG